MRQHMYLSCVNQTNIQSSNLSYLPSKTRNSDEVPEVPILLKV
jgi:hypothetical protein